MEYIIKDKQLKIKNQITEIISLDINKTFNIDKIDFNNLTTIKGYLVIQETMIEEIDFKNITKCNGSIYICKNPNLKRINFSKLHRVLNLDLRANKNIDVIDLSGLLIDGDLSLPNDKSRQIIFKRCLVSGRVYIGNKENESLTKLLKEYN